MKDLKGGKNLGVPICIVRNLHERARVEDLAALFAVYRRRAARAHCSARAFAISGCFPKICTQIGSVTLRINLLQMRALTRLGPETPWALRKTRDV